MIIITGASRNIGKFLHEKYKLNEPVIGTYFKTNPILKKDRDRFYNVNVADFESVIRFFENIKDELDNLTLINCAGISYNAFAHKSDVKEWRKVLETNLLGTYHMIRIFLPLMREQEFGRIINFSSVVAQKGTPGVSAYAASKSALWGLTKTLAQENGSKGITINNINLGYVRMGMGIEQVPEAYQKIILEQIPSKAFCDPEDIFKTVEYLRNTPYINGTSIDLNGGLI